MDKRKTLNVKMEKEVWLFLKKQSIDQQRSMQEIIMGRIVQYKKKIEDRLTRK